MLIKQPSAYEVAILNGLQHKRAGEVYQGTIPSHVVATRRRRNKAARVSRRVNRASTR